MVTVSAVLLAAGESQRMGEQNKLEMPVDGMPLIRRTVLMLLESSLREIIVVTGHQHEKIISLIEDLPAQIIINHNYRDGQMTSVYQGLDALVRPCDGVMICLADQPLLQTEDVDVLISAFGSRRRGSVLVPTWQDQRGNPIILDWKHRAAILSGERNLGCKRFIDNNPDLVEVFAMQNDHVVFDLDTPQDYAQLQTLQRQVTRTASTS